MFLAIPLCAAMGCATTLPSAELLNARAAYKRAEGAASTLMPVDLHIAKESLDIAEDTFADSPNSEKSVDAAYIAQRKAERAEALGNAAKSAQEKAVLEKEAGLTEKGMLVTSNAKLKTAEGALASEKEGLVKEKEKTAAEKEARLAAEKKSKDAMDALATSLALKNDDRGTVITLSGGVVFATGQAVILPGAQAQLNQVADALKTQAEHHFSVEGHTDNQGTDAVNDELSKKRAAAVRDYLVVRGVSPAAITATGFGSGKPIADNKSPEGRAMNRRVEIIVDKSP